VGPALGRLVSFRFGLYALANTDRVSVEGSTVAPSSDRPVDLYVAAYDDANAAQADWDAIKQLADDKVIVVDGLVLVRRDADGKIHEKDTAHVVGGAAVLGAAGGLLVGLIFPPAFLASGVVGAGIGAGVGGLLSHAEKKEIKAEVADDLPPNSSGIVAVFEERWASQVTNALDGASNVSEHKIDRESVEKAKDAAAASTA
jgi:uncharacterized membrane protein